MRKPVYFGQQIGFQFTVSTPLCSDKRRIVRKKRNFNRKRGNIGNIGFQFTVSTPLCSDKRRIVRKKRNFNRKRGNIVFESLKRSL